MSRPRPASIRESKSKSPSLGLGTSLSTHAFVDSEAQHTPAMPPTTAKPEDSASPPTPARPCSRSPSTDMDTDPSPDPSPPPSPPTTDMLPTKYRPSPPSPTPPTTGSKTSTPPTPSTHSKKPLPSPLQLIGHLPVARNEALNTFTEMPDNCYQYKTLGRSRETLESMTCDCSYEPGVDSPGDACGHDSDCINRLTQVECLPDDCRCRSYCQNQRFQRSEYASIEIVQTEKKGFGLRAETDLYKDTFIYEYVGDVVNPPSFKKRMRDYAAEGIQHFYFMMLQKDEFIDATKNGGIGRFANHSCNPNCYVAKWTIGQHVRMGIFAKRNIKKHEELTFNYNVDRYGHQAQTCYCGEPNCVGFIGGKTQTDIATMDDLYLDALGITDEFDLLELKGSKKKRGKKIDDPDFMPILKPIVEKDVPKVVQAMRQTQSRKVLFKLLTRIRMTEDQAALRQIMRLRGFSLMTNTLEDYVNDLELIALALECMMTWPLVNRNKVEDSKVIVPVQACAASEYEPVQTTAQKLLDHWETLPLAYRIPKRMKQDGEEDDTPALTAPIYENEDIDEPPPKRSRYVEVDLGIKPLGFSISNLIRQKPSTTYKPIVPSGYSRQSIAAVIAAAAAAEAETVAAAEAAAAAEAEAAAIAAAAKAKETPVSGENGARRKHKSPRKPQTDEEKEANKEKRLLKLVGAVVVKCMSKHSKAMDHDLFKKHAKELTQLIADKEKKSSSYKEGKLESLSEEKIVKIKKFAKEYIAKVLRKLEKSAHRRRPPSMAATQVASSTSMDTPNSAEGTDVIMAEITAEEAMDMADSPSEGDEDVDDRYIREHPAMDPPPKSSPAEVPAMEAAREPMDLFDSPWCDKQASDPRRRPPNEEQEPGWERRLEEPNGVSAWT